MQQIVYSRRTHAVVLSYFIAVIILMGLLCLTAFAADPVKPKWTTDNCSTAFTHCANVTTKETWSKDGNFIYFFLEAMMDKNNTNYGNTTVWYVGENFDVSWAQSLVGQSFNVVRFSPRGSERAYPEITCGSGHYKNSDCQPDLRCTIDISHSGLNMSHYSIEETARDLEWTLKTLGENMRNVVVAEGLGTFIVQRMLKQTPSMDNVFVVMAGYTHPTYFDLFRSLGNYDEALQELLWYCDMDESYTCISRTGAFEGMWNRFENVMHAAKENTLKCNKKLDWGVKPEKMYSEYSAIVAGLLKFPHHFLLQPQFELMQLIPSFIYRLQRCEPRDVDALTQLYKYLNGGAGVACPPFIPQRYNWLVNELVLSPPPRNPDTLYAQIAVSRLVLPNISVLRELYNIYNNYPKYNVTDRTIGSTQTKLLLLPSDMDAVFSHGMSVMATRVYNTDTHFLPHQVGFPLTGSASNCLQANLLSVRATGEWANAANCTASPKYKLDFINLNARAYYGVFDPWDFTSPNDPEILANDTTPTVKPSGPTDFNKGFNKTTIVFAFFFAVTLIAFLTLSYFYWKKRQTMFSGDFYSNLNH